MSSAPSYGPSVVLPTGITWPSPWPNPPSQVFPYSPPLSSSTQPCGTADTCKGTATQPYMINSISISGGGSTVQLIGGPNFLNPVYYDIASLSESGQSQIQVSGYVVLNVQNSLSITGQGITNGINSDIPPEAVQINFAGTNTVSIGGNGAVSALISAPNATVTLGGGGSKGYMVGAIQANDVSVQGGYPVHYDIQLNRLGKGTLAGPLVGAYSRKKF